MIVPSKGDHWSFLPSTELHGEMSNGPMRPSVLVSSAPKYLPFVPNKARVAPWAITPVSAPIASPQVMRISMLL